MFRLFRLIILGLLVYFGYRLLRGLLPPTNPAQKARVKGQAKSKPLDLNDADVEDAHYRDLSDGDATGRS